MKNHRLFLLSLDVSSRLILFLSCLLMVALLNLFKWDSAVACPASLVALCAFAMEGIGRFFCSKYDDESKE